MIFFGGQQLVHAFRKKIKKIVEKTCSNIFPWLPSLDLLTVFSAQGFNVLLEIVLKRILVRS